MRRIFAVGLMASLAACANLVPRPIEPVRMPAPISPQQHAEEVGAFDKWRLAGRIAVQRADLGFSADIDWRQSGRDFDLRVMTPLNGGTFRLNGGARKVELITPKGESFSGVRPEDLMEDHLGWSIPLDGTRYWIRGIPDPTAASSQEIIDEQGRWTDFEQDRWRVSILDYVAVDGIDLPRRLYLTRDDFKIRIVVKQWERR
ncbi:MAG: lipoprotein insertase outer membrane protein LolB [Gammaproteobacteria bacterium]|nr:lipoprotein insertase outer membrane protein LolB [Gammaproteobacteria bacterium]